MCIYSTSTAQTNQTDLKTALFFNNLSCRFLRTKHTVTWSKGSPQLTVCIYNSARSSKERVQILSSVAPHLGNLCWRTISATLCQVHCSNKYKITQALLHHHQSGAAATSSKEQETTTICTSPEQLAFLVEFLHSTECTERSSYKATDCSRKGRTWPSDILGGHTQKVLHLKHNKEKLSICINRNVRRCMRYLLDGLCLTMV